MEIQRKHEGEMNKLKLEYDQKIEKKIFEMKNDTENQISLIKEMDKSTIKELTKKLEMIQNDTLSKKSHEKILNRKLIEIEEFHKDEISSIVKNHERDLKQNIQNIENKKQKDFEYLYDNLKENNKKLQQEINELNKKMQKINEENFGEKIKFEHFKNELGESEKSKKVSFF